MSGSIWTSREVRMTRKRYSAEQIIGKLREAEVLVREVRAVKEA